MMPYALVTVSDGLTNVSMPYNEFAVYRSEHDPDCRHFFISLFDSYISTTVPYPENLAIFRCGTSLPLLRKTVREIREQCRAEGREILFHIHEGKSALFFHLATGFRYRKRTVFTVHSDYTRYAFHNRLFCVLASLLSREVVCVSRTSYGAYPARLKRLLKDRVTYIQNGVDCDRADLADGGNRAPSGTFRMICVARLIPSKNQALLLRAMKENPGCELTLVGTGGEEESLRALAGRLGIADRVRFTGGISRDEVFRQLKQHDLYVSASEYEGLPVSVLEAMWCGIPCAVSDIRSHREIREQCPSLITVDNTEEGWTLTVRGLSRMDRGKLENIGNANREAAGRFFSLRGMHLQYDAVYAGVLGMNQE